MAVIDSSKKSKFQSIQPQDIYYCFFSCSVRKDVPCPWLCLRQQTHIPSLLFENHFSLLTCSTVRNFQSQTNLPSFLPAQRFVKEQDHQTSFMFAFFFFFFFFAYLFLLGVEKGSRRNLEKKRWLTSQKLHFYKRNVCFFQNNQ